MDCFAVSLGIGTSSFEKSARSIFRLAFHFGFFQGLMAFLGWLAGSTIVNLISNFDHWLAFVLLAWVGIRMIREGAGKDEDQEAQRDPSRGKMLMVLCVATSLDALAVGLSMAMLKVDILLSSLVIGLVSLLLSVIGLLAGSGLGTRFGKKMEILGGLILNFIGLRILFTHLF